MTFQSLEFALLLTAVLAVYWFVNFRGQNLLLLGSSYIFYAYVDPRLALLLAGYTTVTFFAVRRMELDRNNSRRYMLLAAATALGTLGFFKYFGFFIENFSGLLGLVGLARFDSTLRIILPVGISFYTFQSLGYVIDVHMRRTPARTSFIETALFISFFPQLVAGPIERANNLFPQFKKQRQFDPDRITSGTALLAWGFFKKLVIADNVGLVVDSIFSVDETGSALLWVGVFAFGIQILADFSGYTDIARGTARILGIDLSINFRHPWLAKSPTDFWRRWHKSLSEWLRDYVYIPLGGDRKGSRRTFINILVTFMLGGLWHGAAWNFVLWGAIHAGLLIASRGLSRLRIVRFKSISAITTFVVLSATWMFFRESDVGYLVDNVASQTRDTQMAFALGATAAIYSVPLWLHAIVDRPQLTRIWTRNDVSKAVAFTAITLTSFLAILVLRAPASAEFIYFRF